jgi:hypothetical protein
MTAIFFDSAIDDSARRKQLYAGSLFLLPPTPASVELCMFAREMIHEAFGALDPQKAQHNLPVEEYVAILSRLKPAFIHHPKSKTLIPRILSENGCDLDRIFFDVPRMRTPTSDGYLTTGIAYAWHPHRDTWYSAPLCQLNWWMPIYDMQAEDGVAFHPTYWSVPVPNDSRIYNYYEWNKAHRAAAVQYVSKDTRPLPRPLVPINLDWQVRPVCPVGGIILFSAAQLHSSVPNHTGQTRFSIDFRTVHLDDVIARHGAPNVDSECTGSSIRDFLRGTDFSRIPDDAVALFNDGTEIAGDLVYTPPERLSPTQ